MDRGNCSASQHGGALPEGKSKVYGASEKASDHGTAGVARRWRIVVAVRRP